MASVAGSRVSRALLPAALLAALAASAEARVVVFQQPGFPTLDSAAVSREALAAALAGRDLAFADLDALRARGALDGVELLVLPHGSAFPADAWGALRAYLEAGGNLLAIGGRPLFVPVWRRDGAFQAGPAQNGYWRLLAALDAVELPGEADAPLAWDPSFDFAPCRLRARRVFALSTVHTNDFRGPDGNWRGLGFLLDANRRRASAPVLRLDFSLPRSGPRLPGRGRLVLLSFDAQPGYWDSPDGRTLLREAALHAARGPAFVWVELPLASLHEGEPAKALLHVLDHRQEAPAGATPADATPSRVRLELLREGARLDSRTIECPAGRFDGEITWADTETPGLYGVRAKLERDGGVVDVHETGFWRHDPKVLASGARLSAGPTFFRKDGRPYLPIGVNHWVNDSVWPSFPENANALEWDRDFAELAARGLTFVRTGIWSGRLLLTTPPTGAAREPILRNIEALLQTAGRHGLHVQFTFFSFEPHTVHRAGVAPVLGPGRNPYTDPVASETQKAFVRSVVERFADVPFLSYDLINEPSFSNPRAIFSGNQPNGDETEIAAWNEWLRKRYATIAALASAWQAVPEDLGDFGGVPLPAAADLTLSRTGNPRQRRALDYNLFAQEAFSRWASELVAVVRSTGSRQLVGVGQDEGGVGDRLLNQFYGGAVDFTSQHNWWNDDALLWDALAAKRPGRPNLLGETGPQPALGMDGRSRWDEQRGLGLFERKLVLGLAAGNAGAAVWIWSRRDPFHVGRIDGSSTPWVEALTDIARFARDAEPHLGEARPAQVAIVLPQSLQLSAYRYFALEAQQKCVRALYHHARASASVVGEHQIELLGRPRLILLPSPWVLTAGAWERILERVKEGATLLVSGRFDADEHFRPTARARRLGLDYEVASLASRENDLAWPGGQGRAVFSGDKTTHLEQALLPGGAGFARRAHGRGQVLFFTLPLELNDDLALLGRVYAWALARAGVEPLYRTPLEDTGILICPLALETGTLYAFTSESGTRREISLRDTASGTTLRLALDPGRAALLLVAANGRVAARYEPRAEPATPAATAGGER